MIDTAIQFDNVSKKFCKNIKYGVRYGLVDIVRNIFYQKNKSNILRKDEFWGLDTISLEIKKGEAVGIIGYNGSGKTTLLRLINGIFLPDNGCIKIRGEVGALVDIGAGFHPLLSGRENIYVKGAILGNSKEKIDALFNNIVDFAEIGDFLDTPVKYYSTGMFIKLGFAVAIHCTKSDIILIDEAFAVGDQAFFSKCMNEIGKLRASGKTVIIVSHNLRLIRNYCDKTIWLDAGRIREIGEGGSICDYYEEDIIKKSMSADSRIRKIHNYDQKFIISKVDFLAQGDKPCKSFQIGSYFKMRIYFTCQRVIDDPVFSIALFALDGLLVSSNYTRSDGYTFDTLKGSGYIDFIINKLPLKEAKYKCRIVAYERSTYSILSFHEQCYLFSVHGDSLTTGIVELFPTWSLHCTAPIKECELD